MARSRRRKLGEILVGWGVITEAGVNEALEHAGTHNLRIGEALVRACIDRARASGRERVRLDTRTSMTGAQRLYERLGFRRAPDHDWSPAPGILLLGYVLELDASA